MRAFTPAFVERVNGRLINIHPSLLPAFPGLHTHQQALATGVQWHGCTIHFVTPVLDHGPIVAQGVVPVLADDSPDDLAGRVLKVEHRMYADVVRWLAEGRVSLDAMQRVHVRGVASRRSEEHTSELQSLMRISYAVFCLKKKKTEIKYMMK